MPKPRHTQVSLGTTPYYHCVSRCVRRAYLCGEDVVSGQSFEHRRGWIEDTLHELADIFAIDLCAYAVMSNHYHVVLYVDKEEANGWSFNEVIERWHRLFIGTPISQRYRTGQKLIPTEKKLLSEDVEKWRSRLMNISWFMRILNEGIARQANAEDDVTGRFWEGRFKSQALLDEAALIACMAYVDLNPIRAKMADTPETSDFTSIKQRSEKARVVHLPNHPQQQPNSLLAFVGNPRDDSPKGLPFRLTNYLELVDWTGRAVRDDKCGTINNSLSPILERLNLEETHWLYLTQHFESPFKSFVGAAHKLRQVCTSLGYKRILGIQGCETYFP